MRIHPIPLLLVLLLGGAWFLMSEGAEENSVGEQGAHFVEADASPPSSEAQSADSLDLEGIEPDILREDARANPEAASDFHDQKHVLVELVDAETERALPGFDVYWLDTAKDSYHSSGNALRKVLDQGESATTDNLGRVWIPRQKYGARISLGCNASGYFGHRYRLPTDLPEAFRFHVYRDNLIEVEVVHADGSPASDFQVTLAREIDGARPREKAFALTDSNGLAQLRYFRIDQEDDLGLPFTISVGIPSTTPPRLEIDPSEALPAKVQLTLPELSFLQVHAIQADGTPFPDGTVVQLQASSLEPESHLVNSSGKRQWMRRKFSHGFARRTIEGGQVVFPVGLHQRMEMGLEYPWHKDHLIGACDGPTSVGQIKTYTLKEETARSFLEGRIFLADGSPAADLPLELVEVSSRGSSTSRITTESDGIFLLPIGEATPSLRRSQQDSPPLRNLHFTIGTEMGVAHYGSFQFPHSLPPGITDLGEAVLDAPLILGGQTVDSDGNALPATFVTLRADLSESPPFQNGWAWGFCSVRTNHEGVFRFHGDLAGNFHTLDAERDDFQKQQVTLDAGIGDHQVVLKQGENPFLRVLLPEGFSPSRLRLKLSQSTDARSHSSITSGLRIRNGKMDLDFEPGTYQLTLITADTEQVMFRAEDVIIGIGAEQDPRLDPVDLRDVIVSQELTVLGVDGDILPRYYLRGNGQSGNQEREAGSSFHVSRKNHSYLVWADGHRSQTIQLDGTPMEVQLQKEIPLRIHVRGTDSVPALELIQLRLHGDTDGNRLNWEVSEDKIIETNITHPGTYICEATTLRLPDSEGGQVTKRSLRVNGMHMIFLELDPEKMPLVVDIELSLEEDDT